MVLSNLTPTGYKAVSFPRHHRAGGGICFIYRSSINVITKAIDGFTTFECCRCDLTFKEQNICFLCIYRPPPGKHNRHTVKEFTKELQDLLDTFLLNKCLPIIIGDFNIHFDNQSHPDVIYITNALNSYGLHQLVDKPTHRKNHILDWVVTDNPEQFINLDVRDVCTSDHFMVSIEMDMIKPGNRKRVVTTRKKITDHVSFSNDIKEQVHLINSSTSNKVETYNNVLEKLIDKHAPLRSRTVTDRPSAPWMTLDVKQAKAERRRAERKWRSTNGTVFKEIYRHCVNKVRDLITLARNAYYNTKISECLTSKALFHITGSMSGKKTSTSLPKSVAKCDLPGVFANYFKDKVTKIRETLDSATHNAPDFETSSGPVFSDFRLVSEAEVKKIITTSPPKSCCLDPIPTSLLVTHIDSLIEIITIIINESLMTGIVPSTFKQAVVVPLLKKPSLSPDELNNFRPVSNLPFLSKILEKVVLYQLKDHLNRNNLIEIYQSAYRECHSTETALTRVRNDLLCEADKGNVSILALLDLSAAFDTIDHSILVKRLATTFGISGVVLDWFQSYLVDRSQSVYVEGVNSPNLPLHFGVPQGSVLGPILYTLYTQPLGSLISKHDVNYHMYADDTQLYKSLTPHDNVILLNTMERCIDDVKKWMINNKLMMNEDKTEVLFCDPKQLCTSIPNHLVIDNEIIQFSVKAKNLGVVFDSVLSMGPHVNHVSRMLYCELRRMGQMSRFLNMASMKTLMSAFLLSRLDYCNSLFINVSEESINKLQRFQNQAARIILKKKKRDHVTPLLTELHWLPVRARIVYKTALLCFYCIHSIAPSYLTNLIEVYIPSRSLRSCNKCLLKLPKKGSSRLAGRSFTHAAPALWNSLPLEVRLSSSADEFKSRLKTYLFRAYLVE